MADIDETPNYLEKLATYKYAGLAGNFDKNGNAQGAKTSLDFLIEDMQTAGELSDFGRDLIGAVGVSPEAISRAAKISEKRYGDTRKKVTVSQITEGYYNDVLGYTSNENAEIIRSVLGVVGDETIGDIKGKVAEAKYVIQGESVGRPPSEEDKESATRTIQKYDPILKTLDQLEEIKMSTLRRRVEDQSYSAVLGQLSEELRPYVPQQEE